MPSGMPSGRAASPTRSPLREFVVLSNVCHGIAAGRLPPAPRNDIYRKACATLVAMSTTPEVPSSRSTIVSNRLSLRRR